MKKRAADQDPWMPPGDFGRTLASGLSVNLLVRSVEKSVRFAEQVLGATTTYADPDIAVFRCVGAQWMVHADHTYLDHPMTGVIDNQEARGAGVEIRLYGLDPDACEQAARNGGWIVLAGAMDKPHGLRESYIIDDDGYMYVPGTPLAK